MNSSIPCLPLRPPDIVDSVGIEIIAKLDPTARTFFRKHNSAKAREVPLLTSTNQSNAVHTLTDSSHLTVCHRLGGIMQIDRFLQPDVMHFAHFSWEDLRYLSMAERDCSLLGTKALPMPLISDQSSSCLVQNLDLRF